MYPLISILGISTYSISGKWILGFSDDKSFIEASLNAEDDWFRHNQEVSIDHVRSSCSSWYIGANIKGKAKNFMPYVGGYSKYVEKCNEVSENDYEGFILK